jgi:cholesterol transport system auxiliary component
MRSFHAQADPFAGQFQAGFGRSICPFFLSPAVAVMLAACSSAPKLTYDLNPIAGTYSARGGHGQLAIAVPEATLPANSAEIVVRTSPQAVAYLSGAQWADKLPSLIQSRLIESFQNAHIVRAAGGPGILADATLQTDLRRFEFDAPQGIAAVEISAQLMGASGRIIAGRSFSANIPAPSTEPSAVAAALNTALSRVMREIVLWAAPKV